jgi:ABC-type Fe3+ transport system substrate-binding protein
MRTGRRAAGQAKERHAWAAGSGPNQNISREPGTHNAQNLAMIERGINDCFTVDIFAINAARPWSIDGQTASGYPLKRTW